MRLQTIYGAVLVALMFAVVVGASNAATHRTFVTPTITDFTPKSGGQGTKVTITGTGLTGAKVEFFGVPAAGIVVNATGTSVTATVPAPPADVPPLPAPIVIATPGGAATSSANFTYDDRPVAQPATPATPATPARPATPAKKATGTVIYYTYKSKVKLAAGQTIHFRAGKGYYAA